MAGWSVEDVLKEFEDLDKVQKLRPSAVALPKLMEALEHKIQAIDTLTPSMLLQLTERLEASSLPADLKTNLQTVVDDKAINASAGALKLHTSPQLLVSLWNYMSAKEWQVILTAPYVEAVHVCVQRLKAVGVKSMKEQAKKYCLAMLLHLMIQRGEPKPPPMEIYKLSNYLHDCFQGCKQHALVSGLLRYPDKPADLGQDFMQACYKADDYPEPVSPMVTTSVQALLKEAVVRNAHGDLQDGADRLMPNKRLKRKTNSMQDGSWEFSNFLDMMQMMKNLAKNMDEPQIEILNKRRRSSSSSCRSLGGSERLALQDIPHASEAAAGAKEPAAAAAEALAAATIPSSSLDQEATGEPANDEGQGANGLEDFERKAFEELQARSQKQKGKKQETKTGEPKVLKRPAAAKAACVADKAAKKTVGAKVSKPPPAAKAAAKAAPLPSDPKANCWGCSRCRGTPSGCAKCNFPEYTGTRLNGKDAWRKWHAKNCRKQL